MGRNSHARTANISTIPPSPFDVTATGAARIEYADALDCYARWPRPTAIVVDGPYGLSKFPGDPHTADQLAEWYEPHIAEWARCSLPETTLWFWCSEVGWAEVHHVFKKYAWKYRAAHVWNKGVGHIAGNCNGDTIRGFPVVTEICVQYIRDVQLPDEKGSFLPLKAWLRAEWQRSGLPLYKTNEACGVKNAATRKYFTQCHLWYLPPSEKMVDLAAYANKNGKPAQRPYFSLDGISPFNPKQWDKLRAKWTHTHGVTNVWPEPAVRGVERLRQIGLRALHLNQKPIKLVERIILASTDKNDAVWEPFGGLCSAAVACIRNDRHCYSAEIIPEYFSAAAQRLREEVKIASFPRITVQTNSGRAKSRLAACAAMEVSEELPFCPPLAL